MFFAEVKIISDLFIISFLVAIELSDHFNSSHSVLPIAIRYFPVKQSLSSALKISSSLIFKLLKPSINGLWYFCFCSSGALSIIVCPNSIKLSLVIALCHFLESLSIE